MLGIDPEDLAWGRATELQVLERILAEDDLLSADFLRVGARVSSCVGRLHIRDRHRRRAGFGTGFMISPRLMMTNNHVLESAAHGANSTIEFDFVEGILDSVQTSRFFSLDPATFFLTSPGLDYTIVAVGADYDESEARRRGWLNLIEESGKVLVGERLNIVQHPGGGPQKVGLRRNELESVDGDYLIYGTDTEPGSSGSPVCNDQWLLAALHHASVPELDDEGRFVRWVANEGVRISRVVAEARERLRQSTESTNALFDAAFANVPEWASEAPRPGLRSEGSVEIPLRLTLQVSAAGVPGTSATPGAVALPGPQLEPAARDEFLTSPGLDYTIVAVGADYDESEARRRGWLNLIEESGKVLVGERLNIVQHPGGGPQKVGLRRNELESVDGDYLIYGTDTEPGSSGSPVCNDQWLLAALHHASVPELDDEGRFVRWVANEGVRISRVVAEARERLRQSTESTNALFDAAFANVPEWASEAPRPGLRSEGSVEIPLRLTLQVSAAGVPGTSATPGAVALPGPQLEPAARDEFLDPPDGLRAFANPRLECIVVRMVENAQVSSIREELGERWGVEAVDADRSPSDFDLLPPSEITVAEAWSVVHELRADERVILAEPSWQVDSVIEETRLLEGSAEFLGIKTRTDSAAERKHWAPDLIGVRKAWSLTPPAGGKTHGEGIRIAHPDSGYTHHAELLERPGAIDVESGFDYVGGDADAFDEDGFHGTGTASVLMSGIGQDILGVAPKVTLVPLRVAQKGLVRPAPVLLRSGMRRLRMGIGRAIEKDCHVVSISLGWLGHSALHDVIQRAWEENIIIVAAAGNYTGPLVVWPARYRECICMAGCDARRGIWKGSARGPRVDFTGPAQDVWKAGFERGVAIATQSSGTSFATAMTAGVAALWLAFHGRNNLITRYKDDGVRLTEVFRTVIDRSADPPPRSWFGGFGGIVNVERALRTPLPEPQEVRRSFDREAMTEGIDIPAGPRGPSLTTALEILGEDYPEGRRRLADGLAVPEEELEAVAEGCGDELAFHAILAMGRSTMAAQESLGAPLLEPSQMSERLRSQLKARS